MGLVESRKTLVLISQGENALYAVMNYHTCREIVKITGLIDPTMFPNENLLFQNMSMLDITPQYKQDQLQ